MTGNTANGSRNGARSGAQTLALLASPLNVQLLRSLDGGPVRQSDLHRAAGSPAQTTLRAALKHLAGIGAIEKRHRNSFPGVVEHELTAAGRDLLCVLDTVERWLARSPDAPLSAGTGAAKAVIKALTEGWSTTMLRALAARPLSLTELDGVIASYNYPSLERRLAAMRLAGQVEARSANGHGTPYAVSTWLRLGMGPIAAAARWECRHLPQATTPFGRLDVETAFLLAVPLIRLPAGLSGVCRLAAEIPNGNERRLAGVMAEARDCRIVSCATALSGSPDAWALGSPAAWLSAMIELDADRLELGGDCPFSRALVDGLHRSLFGHSESHTLT